MLSALVSAGLALGTAGLSIVAIITIHCIAFIMFYIQLKPVAYMLTCAYL